ncbi:DUF6194 family protein [Isoptericola sp. S6320L]|uniref:DUF6194 family protein n=1 Tax=Isoptericola sp. S6320L TaxID=2926411 RepID=UPI001FF24D37|nr:DUF6194 family protein [Isoptericola sp. S6320L]MCK0116944.1 DUF6194 family protein [Isoptericola sp. S6320L]
MSMDQIISAVRGFDGALVLQPRPDDGTLDIAWGDAFFYYAPDGQVPTTVQPYGTIVTKNYPDDTTCDLDEPGRWRVNVQVGRDRVHELVEHVPASRRVPTDTWTRHPVYGDLGWVCVVDPAERTTPAVLALLRDAHSAARRRYERRRASRR